MRETALVLGAIVAVAVVGSIAGRPLVAFATSGSMAPAIGVGDVFLVDPFEREPEIGDVVLYEPAFAPGKVAVHRVVGGSPAGWLTQGDANPVTDQDAGEPLVTRDRLRGAVVNGPDGEPLLVPQAAAPLLRARLLALDLAERAHASRAIAVGAALAAGALAFGLATRRRRAKTGPRSPRASALLPRGLLARHVALALLAIVAASTWVAAARSVEEAELSVVVAEEPPAGQARSVRPGGYVERELEARAFRFLPTFVVIEGDTRAVPRESVLTIAPGGSARVVVDLHAGSAIGLEEHAVRVARYPLVLPPDATLALHGWAPGLPVLPIGLALGAGAWVWWRSLGIDRVPLRALLGRGRRGEA